MTEREIARKKAAARKARMERERKARNRRVVLTVCLMLAVCVASIGGTIAWLTDKSETVQNTFSSSDIAIDLKETKNPDGSETVGGVTRWNAELVPGKSYSKNPIVTVKKETTVPVYLFVKVNEGTSKTYLDYQLAWEVENSGWTKLDGVTGTVYYRAVEPMTPAEDQSWNLIVNDQITVKSNLLKAGSTSTDGSPVMPAGESVPKMEFTAYAIQQHGMNATEGKTAQQVAWETVSGETVTVSSGT